MFDLLELGCRDLHALTVQRRQEQLEIKLCYEHRVLFKVEALLEEREREPWRSLEDFKRRARLDKDQFRTLAEIGALNSLAGHRRDALWQVE